MTSCDLLISGARVIDGSGGASRFIDVAVDRDRIVALGDCRHWQADTTIDARALVLAPGFIDSHTHDDQAVFDTPDLVCKLSQGVTTVIVWVNGTPASRTGAPIGPPCYPCRIRVHVITAGSNPKYCPNSKHV